MRTPENSVDHDHGMDVLLPQERRDFGKDLVILAQIARFAEPPTQLGHL
jgi:hypothetical protein